MILVTNPDPMKPAERVIYALWPSGKRVTSTAFAALRDHLEPADDGLFKGGPTQTWRLKDASTKDS